MYHGICEEVKMDRSLIEKMWKLLEDEAKEITAKFPNQFEFNKNSKSIFMEKFDEYENFIKKSFMKEEVLTLDRHKIAAILICATIDSNILKQANIQTDESLIFDGNEKLAFDLGLNYMKSSFKSLVSGTE